VPRPRALGPAALEVEVADDAAVGEDPVVVAQVVTTHRLRSRGRPVVRVVEEEPEAAPASAVGADAGDEVRVVPLVDEDEVCAVEGRAQVERRELVLDALESREGAAELVERRLPLLGQEAQAAPAAARLVDGHFVAALRQLTDDPAQEVGVPVVPVGDERVVEEDGAHQLPAAAGWRERSSS
jgi:hypothetical protein